MNAKRPLLDNQINKRTKLGKDLVRRTKDMGDPLSIRTAEEYDLHPGLTSLRYKDLIEFFTRIPIN